MRSSKSDDDEFIHYDFSRQISEEYKILLNQLRALKIKLYEWNKDVGEELDKSDEMSAILNTFDLEKDASEVNSFSFSILT